MRTFDTSQDETSWVTRDKSQNDLICIRFLLCQKRLTVLIITSGAAVYSHDFFGVFRIEQHSRLLLFKKTAKARPLFMSQKMQNEITQYKYYKIYLNRKSEGLYFIWMEYETVIKKWIELHISLKKFAISMWTFLVPKAAIFKISQFFSLFDDFSK